MTVWCCYPIVGTAPSTVGNFTSKTLKREKGTTELANSLTEHYGRHGSIAMTATDMPGEQRSGATV